MLSESDTSSCALGTFRPSTYPHDRHEYKAFLIREVRIQHAFDTKVAFMF